MTKYQILVFSPTGNTLFLANKLKEQLNCEIINTKSNCEHLIIMSSIHAFRIPKTLKKYINKPKKISLIAVGCNTSKINDAAGINILKYAKKNKIEIIKYKILAMPLTIVKKFNNNYSKKIINESIKEITSISKTIEKKDIKKISLTSKLLAPIYYIENTFVKLFGLELKANKNCIKCKKCQKICPKGNIIVKDKPKFKLKCMMCMSCVYNCPKKAIHPRISKFIEFKDGYNIKDYL